MPIYTLEMAASLVVNECGFKHAWGCECWRRHPDVVAERKAFIRSNLGRETPRPLP